MNSKQWQQLIVLLLCSSLIYSPVIAAGQLALPPDDIDAPEISHKPITESFEPGVVTPITATVSDNVGVKSVVLFYRHPGDERYQQIPMQRVGESNEYTATLDEQYYAAPGIEYYIQAVDTSGNRLLHGYAFAPMILSVSGTVISQSSSESAQSGGKFAAALENETDSKSNNYKWLWIGLGVLAVGALASGSDSGGDSGTDSKPTSTSIVINGPAP